MRKKEADGNLLISGQKPLIKASRFSVEYWRDRVFRPTYRHKENAREVQEYYAQMQYQGRREKVGLGTNNAEEAARRAARFYATMRSKGWEAALQQLCPDRGLVHKNPITVGDFITTVQPLANVRPRTFEIYAYALRKIAREAACGKETSRSKFNPKSLGWRKNTDLLPLSKLTPNAVAQWKSKILSETVQNPVEQQRSRRNINSFVRSARALFSRKILKALAAKKITLPTPLPFDGFEFEPQGSTKYVSKIDAGALLQTARKELADTDIEAWKVILLAMGAGLRRSEIDGICWGQVDAGRCEIRIANHVFFQAKTQDSEGQVFVDAALMTELDRFRAPSEGTPVTEPRTPFRQHGASQFYRCQKTFERVTAWLRAHGVEGDRPLHTLRKEFGSIICASSDIHAASRQLRHSNLSTTASFYTDNRRRVTVPVGNMLTAGQGKQEQKEPVVDSAGGVQAPTSRK